MSLTASILNIDSPAPIQSAVEVTEPVENTNITEQDVIDEYEDIDSSQFNPVQLTQILEPSIEVTEISLEPGGYSRKQRTQFLTGMGNAPFVYYNGSHIEYTDIKYFELYHEGILPAIKIIFEDKNGIFRDDGFPLDDTIITIFIYSGTQRLRSIKMDFKVSNFKDMENGIFSIQGIANISKIFVSNYKSYPSKTSFDTLKEIARECKLGFASNISNTNDKMTWINTSKQNYEFISEVVDNSYISDESFLVCYIDFFYNLCYVDIEKEIRRDNTQDKQITSDGKTEFQIDKNDDEKIGPLFLTTDDTSKESNSFIEKYDVINRSTKTSLNNAYSTRAKFYDSLNKELLMFDIDSITQGDKIILKGSPLDEEFFREMAINVWTGKYEKFDDGVGNVHNNYNYASIQNNINITELNKIECNLKLPTPNFNIFITQKIYVALLKDAPGIGQTGGLRYKRLVGNWIVKSINYCFDGAKQFQKIKLIKRDLELFENEKQKFKPQTNKDSTNNTKQDYDNEISPLD